MTDKRIALGVVEAVEATAGYYDGSDHAEGVVCSAFQRFGERISEVLGVPRCTCRWGLHEAREAECPRNIWLAQ